MNLTHVANLSKKIFIPLFILAIIALLIFLIFYRFQKIGQVPPPPPINQPSLIQTPLIGNPQSTQVSEELLGIRQKPAPVPVYQIEQPSLDVSQASNIATSFGFNNPPQILEDTQLGEIYRWQTNNASLSINRYKLDYNQQLPPVQNQELVSRFDSLEDLQNYALQFLEQHQLINPSFQLTVHEAVFLEKTANEKTQEIASLSQADLISLLLAFKLGGIPLIDHNADQTPSSILLTRSGTILSLSYRFPPKLQPLNNYSIKAISEAATEVLQGKGVVAGFISESLPREKYIEEIKINTAFLSKALLVYYLPLPSPEILQPVYVFGGNAQSVNNLEGEVSVLVPAVAEEFLKKP